MTTFYEIRSEQTEDGEATNHAEILIYDEIGKSFWNPNAVNASDFVRDLQELDVETITLRINSPGGSVFDGIPIYNALRRHKATVTVEIDGLAASIASVIALAGDTVRMADNALFMIHNPWSFAFGDADEMRKVADLLDKVRSTITSVYARATDMTETEIHKAMDAETWYDAEEAKAAGFIDEVTDGVDVAALAHFDAQALQPFDRTPADLIAALAPRTPSPAADEGAAGGEVTLPENSPHVAEMPERMRDILTAYDPMH